MRHVIACTCTVVCVYPYVSFLCVRVCLRGCACASPSLWQLAGESFNASIARHEYYLAARMGVQPSDHLLDCGCGIGGPLRNIGRFTGANVTGVTLNQYQVCAFRKSIPPP